MARYRMLSRGVFDTLTGKAVLITDPEWRDYQAWLNAHNLPDPEIKPAPAPPAFDAARSGRAREERVIKRLVKTDPLAALLRKAKL